MAHGERPAGPRAQERADNFVHELGDRCEHVEERRITAAQALDMLQTIAPRPWARRMLAWHIFETTGFLEFTSGTLTEKIAAHDFLEWTGHNRDLDPDCDDPRVLRAKAALPWEEIIVEEPQTPEFPFAFPIEAIFQIDFFDWEAGVARGSMQHTTIIYPEIFEELKGQHGKSWLEFDLSGLSFTLSMIEMLAPSTPPPPNDLFTATPLKLGTRVGEPGRRRTHDWDGALLFLIGEAERNAIAPDPDAHGAQADVAKLMADWFAERGAPIPANSQLQAKAKLVLEHIRAANPRPQ